MKFKIKKMNLLSGRRSLHIKCDLKQTMLVQLIVENSKVVVEQIFPLDSQSAAYGRQRDPCPLPSVLSSTDTTLGHLSLPWSG
jgi:hypothetical protein